MLIFRGGKEKREAAGDEMRKTAIYRAPHARLPATNTWSLGNCHLGWTARGLSREHGDRRGKETAEMEEAERGRQAEPDVRALEDPREPLWLGPETTGRGPGRRRGCWPSA